MPTTVWPRAQKMLYKLVKDTQTKYTQTAAISMSCHRHNRNNTRCTMAGRTKQEEATRIQSWSTQAARVAQMEESNWQTSHRYNPREHGPTSWQKGAEDKCKMNIAARSHYTTKNMQCKLQNKARQMLTQDPWRRIQTWVHRLTPNNCHADVLN